MNIDISTFTYTIFWLIVYGIILTIFFWIVVGGIATVKRRRHDNLEKFNLTFLQIKMPSDSETETKAAEHMFASLMGLKKSWWSSLFSGEHRVSFEIVSKNNGIGFYIVVPDEILSLVEKQINGAYPEAEIDIINPNEIWDRGEFTAVTELKLSSAPYFPIKTYEDLKSDSIGMITSSMSKLKEHEVLAIQYIISPAEDTWIKAARGFINKVKNAAANPDKKVNIDTEFLQGIEKKTNQPGFNVVIRIISIADSRGEAESHIRSVTATFEQFTDIRYNKFRKKRFTSDIKIIDSFIYRKINTKEWFIPLFDILVYKNTSILNTVELATIFHLPTKTVQTPNILWLGSRRSSAPTNIPEAGLYLGKSSFRGETKDIYMKEKDRTRHFYIIGQTGTGKSEFMKSLAIQDIQNGEGVAVIDPHGSDIDDILQKIPEHRIDDVILFDVSDTERPLGINMLEAETEEQKNMVINSFIALLYKLYDPNRQGIMGPQLERTIRNAMLTAMFDPESTMIDVLRLLIDDKYINKYMPLITDPLVKRYWTDEVANTTAHTKSEKMGYMVSKFDRFTTERTMRNILGQPKSAFNFSKVMAEKKILLVDLSKGKIGEENSNFIGLLLVPKILNAALGRASMLGREEFPNFYLYIDEFQNFATPDIATILSEARKYKLNLVVAHQFVKQLDDEIKEAIFGNVGSMTVFRVGAEDGEYLEPQFTPTFSKKDLINTPIGNCYSRLLVDGHPTVPFSMMVDWDKISGEERNPTIAEEIRKRSRMKYGVPVEEVEKYINKRAGFEEAEEMKEEDDLLDFEEEFKKRKIPF